jgi:hypothetical protein
MTSSLNNITQANKWRDPICWFIFSCYLKKHSRVLSSRFFLGKGIQLSLLSWYRCDVSVRHKQTAITKQEILIT